MENMEKRQRVSQNLMTAFTVSLFLLPLLLLGYQTSQAIFEGMWAVLGYVAFTITLASGGIGLFLTLNLHMEIEKDMVAKISKNYPNYRLSRIDYNLYEIEEKVFEVYMPKGQIKFDLKALPTSQIEIDLTNKVAFYK